jgi:hypothetical protein
MVHPHNAYFPFLNIEFMAEKMKRKNLYSFYKKLKLYLIFRSPAVAGQALKGCNLIDRVRGL